MEWGETLARDKERNPRVLLDSILALNLPKIDIIEKFN
jgi:hypothetical protein